MDSISKPILVLKLEYYVNDHGHYYSAMEYCPYD